MKSGSLKRISGYGVAVAAALGATSKADIIYYPNLDATGTSAANAGGAVLLSFNLAGNVATDGSHVANEQFFASHAYKNLPGSPPTSSGPGGPSLFSSELRFHAVGSIARFDPNPLASGTPIGASQTTSSTATLTGVFSFDGKGPKAEGAWTNNQTAFLGLQFDNGGTTNFGWANITVNSPSSITLNSLAYDDSGNSILAGAVPVPEPSQVALFALGAAGVAAFRHRKKNSLAVK